MSTPLPAPSAKEWDMWPDDDDANGIWIVHRDVVDTITPGAAFQAASATNLITDLCLWIEAHWCIRRRLRVTFCVREMHAEADMEAFGAHVRILTSFHIPTHIRWFGAAPLPPSSVPPCVSWCGCATRVEFDQEDAVTDLLIGCTVKEGLRDDDSTLR